MQSLSRRQAFGVISAGAALAAVPGRAMASVSAVPTPGPLPQVGPILDPTTRERADAVARAAAEALALPAMSPPRWARVSRVRSWDASVYVILDEQTRGFVALSPAAMAIAAACQAAGRTVAIRTWGYDPDGNGGAGRFEGAICAVDLADLPGVDPTFSC